MVKIGKKEEKEKRGQGMRLGKYELGRTLGEGNFGKVKLARNTDSGQLFAVKILDKSKIIDLNIADQIKREISTLKILKHPNVVRLYEVLASKTKIYMVLEYVNGGELFDRIASKGKLAEAEGRKLFQQLIDGVSYCHNKGVFHRDLKLENVLVDAEGNIKISDFGLSALPQHFRADGLLHTTCGSPNYVAPEILSNKGYDGATSDTWSCGVILFVILTGNLPFDDRNLAVLYQRILKGDVRIPKWLSPGAQNMIKRILDPNPSTRITMTGIKEDEWFRQDYIPANPEDEEEDVYIDDEAFSIHEGSHEAEQKSPGSPTLINAFQLIGMSSCLDLSGFFEKEDVSERKIRFTSNLSVKDLIERLEDIVTEMGYTVQKKNGKLKVVIQESNKVHKGLGSLSVAAELVAIYYGTTEPTPIYNAVCTINPPPLPIPSAPSSQEIITVGEPKEEWRTCSSTRSPIRILRVEQRIQVQFSVPRKPPFWLYQIPNAGFHYHCPRIRLPRPTQPCGFSLVASPLSRYYVLLLLHGFSDHEDRVLDDDGRVAEDEIYGAGDYAFAVELAVGLRV
ncbi:CBL-interacting serine/threonine-protein kinase 1-like isoform X1 [Senna tora]|uniref:non-specific serine/threonine protein kinase n=1 Tax=Senna tora TaxID=362788 RepID=A0A834X3G4_9FABA|nr:CBL-interacting serine/threonine-protein kinase 1-like isoform X1 [Senna tora]